ncbi:BAR-domain-containing protein [Xylaria nigripes]|nr:BAR-domain-containing protein [Xylaria nigripes]
MERLQKSANTYIKSLSRRGEVFDDKEKGLPVSYLGRTMIAHGEEFDLDSEFGNCLIAVGRANERVAGIQESYVAHATSYWLDGLERSLAMMKEYQSARKKLENRRLTYEAGVTKMQKAKREDFRLEDELRTSKAKYEESSEDVYRRMMDIKEAEADSIRDLSNFLDSELDYYERCAEELRRVRQEWPGGQMQASMNPRASDSGVVKNLTRQNTARLYSDNNDRTDRRADRQDVNDDGPASEPPRLPLRSNPYAASNNGPSDVSRPGINRAVTHREPLPTSVPEIAIRHTSTIPPSVIPSNVGTARNNLRPISKSPANQKLNPEGDDYDAATSSGSPEYERSESPPTSYGSLSRPASNNALRAASLAGGARKAPPPPPPSRAKKPAPPIPAKRDGTFAS